MTRNYRGYVIAREDNGGIGSILNRYPGKRYYYAVSRNHKHLADFDTLTRATAAIDRWTAEPLPVPEHVARCIDQLREESGK